MVGFLGNDWDSLFAHEFEQSYFRELRSFLNDEYSTNTVYPPVNQVFEALKKTSLARTKVVLLGQDPYHGQGQAHGLAFSVPKGSPLPPSLRNIFRELKSDLGYDIPRHGSLEAWADQGVLLLNTTLTVRAGEACTHQGRGWEKFTDAILAHLNRKEEPIVFLLWGKHAQSKAALIKNPIHLVLKTVHPSPLSAYRGFFGSAHFSKANEFLIKAGQEPIDWQV